MSRLHRETHLIGRIGWLRAAVLGANDGIVSTASLIVGVASAGQETGAIVLTGTAALVAGAMSMAAGEYVSVSSQADVELAERRREAAELATQPNSEREELVDIYLRRGLDQPLAEQVADRLTSHDALATHLRDELGLAPHMAARPAQAALSSAAAFATGAALPLLLVLAAPLARLPAIVAGASLLFLALLGAIGARTGGAPILPAVLRVTFWGALAMGATGLIGRLFDTGTGFL